jgi:4-diphosphocytidyl-2-C-methyl-D-erythritol kinase
MEIGLALGADVPFFVFGAPALARGVGERLTAVSLPPRWACVLVPPVAVPTAAIFAAPELTRATPSEKMDVFSEGYGRNDLQAVAVARFPEIAVALDLLGRRSASARMTGSGACAFACFASEAEAAMALADLRGALPGVGGFVARTLARHPLAAFA